MPVTFPPGRLRLAMKPLPAGSMLVAITIGIVVVALWATRMALVASATMTSIFSRTSSSAKPASLASSPSANR